MKKECLKKPAKKGRALKLSIAAITVFAAFTFTAQSQEALRDGSVAPMGQWLEYREANFLGNPILVHLRTGYERAIVMPEAVELSNNNQQPLPGCEIIVNSNIIAFYPTGTFTRRPAIFVGKETGTVYDLRIRASTKGMRQPMRINR